MPGHHAKCQNKFNALWSQLPNFSWMRPVKQDVYSASCVVCLSTFSVRSMGFAALTSHSGGKKHIKVVQDIRTSSPPIFENATTKDTSKKTTIGESAIKENEALDQNQNFTFVGCSNTCNVHCHKTDTVTTAIATNADTFVKKKSVNQYLIGDEVTKAEVVWCVKAVIRHHSLRDVEENIAISRITFPDSEIAKKVILSRGKAAYTIVYGRAKVFEKEFNELISIASDVVLGFDESLNKVSQKNQMDIAVRFWDEVKGEVITRYYTSAFLGKATALDLLDALKRNVPQNVLAKIIQMSMDGPNVNLRLIKDFQVEVNENLTEKTLLDLGTWGLHTVHGAFKTGIQRTGWDLVRFLRALYNLFKYVPSRRADYT